MTADAYSVPLFVEPWSVMAPLRVAFLWHHHQPCYRDLRSGVFRMPWVRLHGTKDYYGMTRLLRDAGGAVRATINLVPGLIEQIEDYVGGKARDPHLELSRRPPGDLSAAEKIRALDLFFMADHERAIGAWPRYHELLVKRRPGRFRAEHVAADFSRDDMRDLQVWANLAWFHRTLLETDEALRGLVAKGFGFTEGDKEVLFRRQREVLAEVLPLHRALAEAGIVELTASPAYHPILPLLVDMECAREGLPGTPLPTGRVSLVEDAREHLGRAVACHERVFGRRPAGLWPSEGSVSPGILPLVKEAGFAWLATDQGVLAESVGRGRFGEADLYRAWRAPAPCSDLSMVFRDHGLSDLIGFSYRGLGGATAAGDFLGRLRNIGQRHGKEALVTVILDGENPWEHYPEGGLPFLRALYDGLARAGDIETVRISDHLAERPPEPVLPRLRSGSWINADFSIWIGHPADVRSFEYLFRVREDFVRLAARPGTTADAVEEARRSLLVAEGSDWNWWYGEDHSSGQDEEFDDLYRTHLSNVYRALGAEVPAFLGVPVPGKRRTGLASPPTGLLDVTVDGRATSFFEWLPAGRYLGAPGESAASGGAMHQSGRPILTGLRYGSDRATLFLRADLRPGWREDAAGSLRLVFRIHEPRPAVIEIPDLAPAPPELRIDGRSATGHGAVAVGRIVEVRVPFEALPLHRLERVALSVEVWRGEILAERLPGAETVRFTVPGDDFVPEQAREVAMSGGTNGDSELRKDPVIDRWVIISGLRNNRPHDFKVDSPKRESDFCPFCEGNEKKTPPEIYAIRREGTVANDPGWRVRVVPNKFPVLTVEGSVEKRAHGMYDRMRGLGAHEVFIETPRHLTSITELPEEGVRDVLSAYRARLLDLERDSRLRYGMLFKNVGALGGASLEHTHSQLIATPVVPRRVMEELAGAQRFFEWRDRCVFCDIIDQELSDEERLVLKTERFVAITPYAARFPFETWILPRRHSSHFEASSAADIEELAFVLRRVLRKLELALKTPPYNYMFHTAPFQTPPLPSFHWHIEVIPRVTRTAGFEWGTGFYINPVAPETAAAFLREMGED
jgi:galactose-1-phosphate uridylyltransferase (family 1)